MQNKNIHIIDQQNKTFWFEGSPLALCSTTFFKNPEDGRLYLDAHFQNEQSNEIASATIKILCYDTSRRPLTPADSYTYTQLSCTRNGVFGEDCNIRITNTNTRFVEVILMSVVDVNGNTWENAKEQKFNISLQQSNIYSSLGKYYPIFHDICKEHQIHPEVLMFNPQTSESSYWLCGCGCFNWPAEKKCVFCHTPRSFLETYTKDEQLDERFQRMNEKEKLRTAERLKDLLKQHQERLDPEFIRLRNIQLTKQRNRWIRKRFLKIITVIFIIIAVIIGCYTAYKYLLKPSIMYTYAQSMMNSGEYQKAVTALEDLGDYQDSEQLIIESKYNLALQQYSSGELTDAIETLSSISNYMDSALLCLQYQYELAEKMVENEDYSEALALYTELDDYADTAEKRETCQHVAYQAAYSAYQRSEYGTTLQLLNQLTDYTPANMLNKILSTMKQILNPCFNGEDVAVWSAENQACPICQSDTLTYTLNFYPDGTYTFEAVCKNGQNYEETLSGNYSIIYNELKDSAHGLCCSIISISSVNADEHNGRNTAIIMQNPFDTDSTITVYGNIIDSSI